MYPHCRDLLLTKQNYHPPYLVRRLVNFHCMSKQALCPLTFRFLSEEKVEPMGILFGVRVHHSRYRSVTQQGRGRTVHKTVWQCCSIASFLTPAPQIRL